MHVREHTRGCDRAFPICCLRVGHSGLQFPLVTGWHTHFYHTGAAAAIDARKKGLSYAAALLLALVPWTQVGLFRFSNFGFQLAVGRCWLSDSVS